MRTERPEPELPKKMLLGLVGIFLISDFPRTILRHKATRISVILGIIAPVISFLGRLDPPDLIAEIVGLMISALPTILGFTIAGYSLIVGFVQSNMIEVISDPNPPSAFSLYQKMSATFALNIILQALALAIAYAYYFISYFDAHSSIALRPTNCLLELINFGGLALISFLFVVSILLIIQIVSNIFGFSQLIHYIVNKRKTQDKN